MQLSNIPGKLVLPFANAGGKNTIPVASQIGITAGAASLVDGFPPLTRTPIAAGGVPPSGLDMNGILYEMSAIIRWANAGGGYPYDSAFAADTNVGGYPKGARVMRSDGTGYWFNTAENNVTDPENAGAAAAGWVPDYQSGATAVTMTSANVTLTPVQYGKPVVVITGVLTANLNLIFPNIVESWTIINGTSGNYTITAKTAAGTGVTLNSATAIYCDGVNVIDTLQFKQTGIGTITRRVFEKLQDYRSFQDFGATGSGSNFAPQIAATFADIQIRDGGAVDSDGSVLPITSPLLIDGDNTKGTTLNFKHTTLTYGSGVAFTAGSYANPGDQRRSKFWINDLNVTGPGKAVAGTVAFKVDETADVFTQGGTFRNSEHGLHLNGALLCDFHSPTIRANGTGIYGRPTVNFSLNHNNFYSAKIFDNDKAVDYNGPGLSQVNWFGCEIEGNNQAGTPADGVSVIKLTNAGRHNFIGAHMEQNYGQIGLDYSGSSTDKNLLILGSEIINQSDTELKMRVGKLTAIASYIASGASTKDIDITTGATATLIDTDSQVVGDMSRLISINYGRLYFGGNAFKDNAPIYIHGASYYAGIAQWFRADSTLLQFDNLAGTRIGYIFSHTTGAGILGDGVQVTIGQNSGARCVVGRSGLMTVEPGADNTTSCGSAAVRFSTVYAATGTINTSDARAKQQIRDISEIEAQVARKIKCMLKAFKFNDSVGEKGDKARIHFGVIAQDVEQAFIDAGLDPQQYALFCHDEWDESPEVQDENGNVISAKIQAGERYGIRYEELFAFILGAM